MEAVGAADDVFYDEEEEEVNCYDFEPLPTLLEDEVSEAGAGTEPPPPLRSPVVRRPRGRPAGPPVSSAARAVRTDSSPAVPGPGHNRGLTRPAGSGQAVSAPPFPFRVFAAGSWFLLPYDPSYQVGLSPSPLHLSHTTAKSWSSSVE